MAVKKAVDHKIHAPAGIRPLDLGPQHPAAATDVPSRALPSQVETFLAVDPIGPLMIDAPALAPKQNLDPTISVPNSRLRDLDDPPP